MIDNASGRSFNNTNNKSICTSSLITSVTKEYFISKKFPKYGEIDDLVIDMHLK